MIATLFHVALLNLRRDRVMQAMVFVLPIVFFSIFAGVFGQQARVATSRLPVAVVDEDRSAASARLVALLEQEAGLRVRLPRDRAEGLGLVRAGDLPVAIVIPAGYGAGALASEGAQLTLLADGADPVAPQIVSGLLQRVAMTASAGLLAPPDARAAPASAAPSPPLEPPVGVQVVDVLGENKANPAIAFYAGGIAVMFLLFNASGAGGALLDEVESGTLERLLGSSAGMGSVLAAKWLFITAIGVCQTLVMFLWGLLAFDLDLLGHLPGFAVMTVFTAAAAAGFGLLLATLCRSRQQLGGLAAILILTQSALGGSMFPRYLMSDTLQRVGLFTFNAWALDGYIKVFWRDAPLSELWPQLAVLTALTALFLALARLLARRWEIV